MKLKELANEPIKKTKVDNCRTRSETVSRLSAKDSIATTSRLATSVSVNEQPAKTTSVGKEKEHPAKSRLFSIKKKRKLKLEKLKMKRKLKKELKKQEVEENEAEPEIVKDIVKFGEVVHRPPKISTLPRVVSKPGFVYRVSFPIR